MKTTAFRAAASVGALLLSLALVEAGFRLLGVSEVPQPMNVDRGMTFHERDPALGYRLRPGARGTFQGVEVRINQRGCRGPEDAGDGPLIIALGDSITFGAGVDEARTFPARLRAALSGGDPPIRVLDCGVSGWNLEQEMIRFDRDLAALKPRIVVLDLFVDDLSPPYELIDRSAASWLRMHSAAFRWAELSRLWPGHGNRPLPPWARDTADYGATVQREFSSWLDRREREGAAVIVVTHPQLHTPQEDPAGPLAQLGALAEVRGLPLVRMRPVYEEATGDDMLSLSIHRESLDPHPDARGHALIAEAILRTIDELGLFGPQAAGGGPALHAAGRALPGRICALLGEGDVGRAARARVERGDLRATWVAVDAAVPTAPEALAACRGEGMGGLLLAGDPRQDGQLLRDPGYRAAPVALATPTAPPPGGWPENVFSALAPPSALADALGSDPGGLLLLRPPGDQGDALAAALRSALDGVEDRALDADSPARWAEATAGASAASLLLLGPPPCAIEALRALGDRRLWLTEWSAQPEVLGAAVESDVLPQVTWITRLPPAPDWQGRGAGGDSTSEAAAVAAVEMLDRAVGTEGRTLEAILDRLAAPEPGASPFGGRGVTRSQGLLHLADARFGLVRAEQGPEGWVFGPSRRP